MPFANEITGGQGALVRPRIKSPDYIPGVQGWSINKDGSAEFNDVTVRGDLFVTDPDGSYVHIYDENPGDGAVIELRLPDSAGAVIVPAQIRSGTDPVSGDAALTISGPQIDGSINANLYLGADGVTDTSRFYAEATAIMLSTLGSSLSLFSQSDVDIISQSPTGWVILDTAAGLPVVLEETGLFRVEGDAEFNQDVDVTSTGQLVGEGIGVPLGVRKSGNTTRVNTTAMAVDPHLQLPVVPGTYDFEIDVRWTADPAPDIKFDVGQVPAGTTLGRWSAFTNGTAAVWSTVQATEATALFQAATLGVDFAVLIKGTAVFTNAGTFGLRWAQNALSANGSTVYAGSKLSMVRRA